MIRALTALPTDKLVTLARLPDCVIAYLLSLFASSCCASRQVSTATALSYEIGSRAEADQSGVPLTSPRARSHMYEQSRG
ncbi:hypothetical protein WJX73_007078 [Symbiochloris irregularis]|uniref:Uncharacterized protein n=1 Tax=Symbiochloris irregularis TaxID=706552 RepID=A0AAW1PAB2_9CHLO